MNHAAVFALAFGFAFAGTSRAEPATSTALALEAKAALDAYYGNPAQLERAAQLLTRAVTANKADALVWVQAARLTVKGGHVVRTEFRPGSLEAYGELLDRALSIDPNNAKAHILKAEYFDLKGDLAAERAALDKARQTGTDDPWLLVGYGRLHRNIGDLDRAIGYHSEARARGPGSTLEQRNAYVGALNGLANCAAAKGDENALRELTEATRRGRDPRDAWALGNHADFLVRACMFDEAITVAREALRTMDYGAGRLTLAAAQFGKAAQLTIAGNRAAAAPLLTEARSHGYSGSSVLSQFRLANKKCKQVLPALEPLLN